MRGDGNGATGPIEAEAESPPKRLTTGSRELDGILGGGIPSNSINILMGEPGSGKTILAEQFIFANAAAGGGDDQRVILYLTTVSEPLDKVVKYLQEFEFFDAAKMGGTIVYDALGPELAEKGGSALLPRIKDAIKTLSPKIIVIDSFKAIHDLTPSVQEMRVMLHDLGGLLTAYSTTVILVGEYRHEDIATYPEFAVADGIVELARNTLGTRDERYLRVLKLRGSSYKQGAHVFQVTGAGLKVYPRLVSPDSAASYDAVLTRVPSGIPGLDPLLAGGLWTGSATLLAGPTGSGKTTTAIQFVVEGLRQGEPCLFVNFQENPTQLAHQIEGIGGRLDDHTRDLLELLYYSAVELPIDSIVVSIFQKLQWKGIRRVAIDALGDLSLAAGDSTRMHNYLYAMVQHFAVMGVTSLLTLETDPPIMASAETQGRLSHMTDNIVFLGIAEKDRLISRTLRIAKARGIAHDLQVHEMRIDSRGVRVIQDGK